MPTQKFAFKRGGEKKLEISNPRSSKFHTISLNGKTLATITKQELRKGWSYQTSKGVLTIEKGSGLASRLIDVRWNGKALPGSSGDPQMRLNVVTWVIFFIAIINLVLGVIVFLLDRDFFGIAFPEDAPFLVLTALIYGVLGVFTRRGSAIALGLTVAGYSFDTLFLLIGAFEAVSFGIYPDGATSAMVTRAVFFYYLFRGFAAIFELKREAANTRPDVDVAPFQPSDKRAKSFFEPEPKSGKPAVAPRKANKLSTIEMILIGIVVILVVVIGDLLLLGASLNSNPPPVNQVAAAPTVAITQRPHLTRTPSATPPPGPTATPYPYGTIVDIPFFDVLSIAYSSTLQSFVALVDDHDLLADDLLHIYNPITGAHTTAPTCKYPALSLELSPSGNLAAIGYQGGVCVVDLQQKQVIKNVAESIDYQVMEQVIADDGWLAYPLMNEREYLYGMYTVGINKSQSQQISEDVKVSSFTLNEDGLYITHRREKVQFWDILNSSPQLTHEWDFRYITDLACDEMWISKDGRHLFDACGYIYELTIPPSELTPIGRLSNTEYIVDVVELVDKEQIIVIAAQVGTGYGCYEAIYSYDRITFELQTTFPFPVEIPCSNQLFVDQANGHYYIMAQLTNSARKKITRVVIGDLSIFSK